MKLPAISGHMFFEREQYTTPVYEMQGCAALLRRKRQKTDRSELLPVVFVQFLRFSVRLRQPEQRAEEKKQRCRGSAAAIQPRQYHAVGG